ncbi:nSTAND1 domain-containing NTPase [Actinophytocola algeriensis]|uniref:non-specific serine/threonine protein kinase n=1 Tax=Actinophytocola algeriensis TaxID=1768010 RepID=A0A7W7Q9Q5_9PSEU|nr:protein kinase [Actinophytocola algeriensis]MBB4909635.1 serine/threonine protein kinase/WD40 repeat protein [Actinophytocola algeriensis]MBE1475625.1 serine/threonine protein kinase/WD40 repeat protein [Actinophytocola algeriensis]
MNDDTATELFGPYRIEELLGRGGMGEVHRAFDTEHERHVALKRLPATAGAEFRARFRREAKLVAGLREPHVIPIHAHGEIDGRLYLDMALVDGPDLKRVLADGPLSLARAVEILGQVATALDAAHAAGVLHRDVKPANILLDRDGKAYLADFGIARSLADDVTKLTNTGDYIGTLDYMAPERLMRGDVDAASDVYSLACVLFQCLTGRVPFPAPDSVGKLSAQLNDPPPAPSLFDRRIPAAMDLVVRTGMEKDPKRRYPSAGELMAAAAAVTAEAPTAVQAEATLTGGHFVQLLMTVVSGQDQPRAHHTPDSCPYPGLQSFGVRDSDWFYGREQSVRDLLARLSRQRADDGPLIVVGASGAGKSSLLNAGLLAAHARSGEKSLAMTPGDRPIGTLAARLAALVHADPGVLAQRLWERPAELGELCQAAAGDHGPLVIAVDQAEELFTLCRDPREREAFATALASAWPARAVLAVRADFVEHCITLPALKHSLAAPYVLGPLSTDELARVVTQPARAAGLELEPGLVDRLITDVGAGRDPGALPRLAHALRETWHNRDGNRLTLNGYQRTGGVDRAVALTADGVYNRLPEPDRWALRAALLRMVTLLDGGGIARRRARRDEVPPRILESLVAARLVTVDRDTVALSHDALLTAWPRLREWVEEDRQGLLIRQQLAEAAGAWRKSGQDRGDLYRGARLAAALDWSGGRTDITPDEHAFLQASDRDRRRTTRRLRVLVAGLASLLAVALVAGVVAVISRADAQDQRNVALSRQFAAESLAESQVDPVSAMRKAVQGWRASPTVEARGALLSAPGLTYPSSFASGVGQGYSIDISPDGRLVAIGSGEGEVALWDLEKRERLDVDISGAGTIRALRFSPDGRMLAVSSIQSGDIEDSGVKIWSVPGGTLIRRLRHNLNAFGPVSWRPDGAALAALSVDTDGKAKLGEWEPGTGNLIRWIAETAGDVSGLEYSKTGTRLAAGHASGVVDLWDPATGGLVARHDDHFRTAVKDEEPHVPVQVAFSDELLASVSVADNTIRLWHAETGALVREFRDVTRHATDVGQGPIALSFSSDGSILYTNSDSTTLTAWDTLTGSYGGTLAPGPRAGTTVGHTVLAIAVSGDGRTKVAATSDGTVLRWHSNTNWYVRPIGSVTGLDFGSDSRTLLAGDAEGGLEMWDARSGRQIAATRLDSSVFAARFTPDGSRITGTADATFTVTAERGGFARPRSVRLTGRDFRGALVVSPDGKTFAAAHESPLRSTESTDYKIGVWDVATLKQWAVLDLGTRSPADLTFSPDGKRLVALVNSAGNAAVGSDPDGAISSTMVSWRTAGFDAEEEVPLDENSLSTLAFTPDSRSVLTAGTEGVVQVRDAVTGEVRATFGSHSSTVREIAVSADGRRAATVTVEDPVVRLWDLADRALLAVLTGHGASLNEVVFAPDGSMLASGGTDTDVGVWQLDPEAVVRQLCDNLADAGEEDLGSLGC